MTNHSRLTKQQSRQRWSELRDLVREWDPLGVMVDPEWPRDEYDCFVGPVASLLERDAPLADIAAFLQNELQDHFGLDPANYHSSAFALKLKSWFKENWSHPNA